MRNLIDRYDAIFDGELLGIELTGFGAGQRVVRVSGTHPIGIPFIGDQVVGVNGVSLLNLDPDSTAGSDVLGFIG